MRLGRGARARWRSAKPFRHLVVDGVLPSRLLRDLGRSLPPADAPGFVLAGDGVAIRRDVAGLGPAWAEADALLSSEGFRASLGEATGIRGLARTLNSDCGGLFRYGDGIEMDVHVDSSDVDRHCAMRGHWRRLIVITYLTPGWREEWGGSFDLYPSPFRHPRARIPTLFGRTVVFDSTDSSWHGVSPIRLPPSKAGLFRWALIAQFNSAHPSYRRRESPHFNFLYPRALPAALRPGRAPSLEVLIEAYRLLERRDGRIAALLAQRAAAEGRGDGRAPRRAPDRDPFAFLGRLPAGVSPGRKLSRPAYAALKRLFAERDRELVRLYRGQLGVLRRLEARGIPLAAAGSY